MNYLKQTNGPVRQILYVILIWGVILTAPLVSPMVQAEEPGTLKWRYNIPTNENLYSYLTIGENGTIYVGSSDNYLYAIKRNGNLKWRYETGGAVISVAIGKSGVIYAGSRDSYLYAINTDGTLKWRYKTNGRQVESASIGAEGTIYVGSFSGDFYAFSPDGALKWRYSGMFSPGNSAVGADGTVYVVSTSQLYALSPEGNLKWRYDAESNFHYIAISEDGTLYSGTIGGYLYALSPEGNLKWRYDLGGRIESSPTIGEDGTIYIGTYDNCIYAMNPNGTLKWRYETEDSVASSPAISKDGIIYVGSADNYLYALSSEGDLKWRYDVGPLRHSAPTIGNNGNIYIVLYSRVYSINGGSRGLADSPWPMFGQNPQHTSRAEKAHAENHSPKIEKIEISPTPSYPGESVEFKAIATDPDDDPLKFIWTLGGVTYKGSKVELIFNDDALMNWSLKVTDGDGDVDKTSGTHRIRKAETRVMIHLQDLRGKDLNGKLYVNGKYKTYTGEDGKKTITGLSSGSHSIKAEKEGYSSNNVEVSLSPGEKEEITLTLEEKNKLPNASFTFSPSNPKTNQTVKFNSDSTDPNGSIDDYSWVFDDGSSSSTEDPNHSYDEPGTYEVELTVTDTEGATDSTTKEVTVENRKPTPSFTHSPKEPKAGQQVTFDATSSMDPDGKIQGYGWDMTGAGSTDKSGSKVNYTYDTKGTYTIKLTVTDNNGASVSTSKEIKVAETQETEEVNIDEKYALVIGIADYKHDTITDLKYSNQDAKDFYRFLISDNYEKFPKEKVTLLTNEEATTQAISREMSQLVTEVDSNDLVIIYYSGHGASGPDYNNDENDGYDEYYVTYDTNTASGAKLYSTGISDDQFGNWLTSMESKQLAIFLDSCYSGGATKSSKGTTVPGQKALPKNEVFNDFSFEDRLLFAASKEDQPSWESEEFNNGVFTHFLLEGLKGEADKNNDGEITSDELYDYLRPQVTNYVDEHFTTPQTPLMKGAISAPLAQRTGKLEGKVKYVKETGKEEAGKGDYVVIDLGEEDGVKMKDRFEVYYTAKGVGVFEEIKGQIRIMDVIGPHLAVGKVLGSELTVEEGYKVRKAKND